MTASVGNLRAVVVLPGFINVLNWVDTWRRNVPLVVIHSREGKNYTKTLSLSFFLGSHLIQMNKARQDLV